MPKPMKAGLSTTGRVGAQLGVGEVVLGGFELAPGLVLAAERRGRRGSARLEGLLHEGDAVAELQVAVVVGLGAHVVGVGGGIGRARIVDGQPIVGGIEFGDQLARLHDGADVDGAADDLAGDAEAQSALDARHDGAGQHERPALLAIGDLHDAGGAHGGPSFVGLH